MGSLKTHTVHFTCTKRKDRIATTRRLLHKDTQPTDHSTPIAIYHRVASPRERYPHPPTMPPSVQNQVIHVWGIMWCCCSWCSWCIIGHPYLWRRHAMYESRPHVVIITLGNNLYRIPKVVLPPVISLTTVKQHSKIVSQMRKFIFLTTRSHGKKNIVATTSKQGSP